MTSQTTARYQIKFSLIVPILTTLIATEEGKERQHKEARGLSYFKEIKSNYD
jgi:hypothetical protein